MTMINQIQISKSKFQIFLILGCLMFVLGAPMALAEGDVKPTTIPCTQNLPCISEATQETSGGVYDAVVNKFGGGFLKSFLGIVAVTCVIFIIVGGMQMHLAFGNEEGIKKAKTTLIWAIVGLVISMLSVAIVQIISKLGFQ
jgi:hypothetical protein